MKRYLKRSRADGPRILVLLASDLTPERWTDRPVDLMGSPSDWRLDLCPLGGYWDEEAVGKLLVRSKVPLTVVAPRGASRTTYPFPKSNWLDVCPRDMRQIHALAPALNRRKDHPKRSRKDDLLDAMCRAAKLVQEETPWTDGWNLPQVRDDHGDSRNTGWSAYARAHRLEERFRLRRKPWDLCIEGDPARHKEPIQEAGRALAMIGAAKDVMKHHAKTPWGWTVYYSEADTFIWKPVFAAGYVPSMKPGEEGEKERDTPWTPRGGSSGGGPTTGGGGR